MTTSLSEEQITIAVEWWANAVCERRRECGKMAAQHTGDSPEEQEKIFQPSERSLKAFKLWLGDMLRKGDDLLPHIGLQNDYDPAGDLYDALNLSGIPADLTSLPSKTHMTFLEGGVQVTRGGNPKQKLL